MFSELAEVVFRLGRKIGTPRALTVVMMVDACEWAQLAELRCEPRDYTDAEHLWGDRLMTDLLRKCDLPSGVDTAAKAREDFFLSERQCALTNLRLYHHITGQNPDEAVVYDGILRRAKRMVRECLGGLPLEVSPLFSGGSTVGDRAPLTTAPDKMSGRVTTYAHSAALELLWAQTSWFRALVSDGRASAPSTVAANVFFTVPKDGKTDRGCCMEASLPLGYQLATGKVLKERLRGAFGICLETGQQRHSALARKASIDGSLATIDMSRASDTLAKRVVDLFLAETPLWKEWLYTLRATHTLVGGRRVRLEKFSSMGNGFTFELETLIFTALARAVCEESGVNPSDVTCYGDDLIVPQAVFHTVMEALRYFGFTPNEKKTFGEGPFRESCGGDFFEGIPVNGVTLEKIPTEPQHWISLANGLRRVAAPGYLPPSRWKAVLGAWTYVVGLLPTNLRRCKGPETLGDVCIHTPESEWLNPEKLWVWTYSPVAAVIPWHYWTPSVQLASCTLGLRSEGVTPRGGVEGYRVTRTPLPSIDPRKLLGLA